MNTCLNKSCQRGGFQLRLKPGLGSNYVNGLGGGGGGAAAAAGGGEQLSVRLLHLTAPP